MGRANSNDGVLVGRGEDAEGHGGVGGTGWRDGVEVQWSLPSQGSQQHPQLQEAGAWEERWLQDYLTAGFWPPAGKRMDLCCFQLTPSRGLSLRPQDTTQQGEPGSD